MREIPPLVPPMPTPTTETVTTKTPTADGGEPRMPPERSAGAPLVPDAR